MPLIGASGAIAGVVAAYLVLHPRVKVWVLAFARIPLRMPAYIALALWILFQFVMFAAGGEDQISWAAMSAASSPALMLVFVLQAPRRAAVRPRDRHAARRQVEQTSAVRPVEAAAGAALGPAVDFEPIASAGRY